MKQIPKYANCEILYHHCFGSDVEPTRDAKIVFELIKAGKKYQLQDQLLITAEEFVVFIREAENISDDSGAAIVLSKLVVRDDVDLSKSDVKVPIELHKCVFEGEVRLDRSNTRKVEISDSTINRLDLSHTEIDGYLKLENCAFGSGAVKNNTYCVLDLTGTHVSKFLSLRNSWTTYRGIRDAIDQVSQVEPDGTKSAIELPVCDQWLLGAVIKGDGMQVGGTAYLDNIEVAGCSFRSCNIGGNFRVRASKFHFGPLVRKTQDSRAKFDAIALDLDGSRIANHVFLSDGFEAIGKVRMRGTLIGGRLRVTKAKFSSLRYLIYQSQQCFKVGDGCTCLKLDDVHDDISIQADSISTKRSLFIADESSCFGRVRLRNAKVGSRAVFSGASLSNHPFGNSEKGTFENTSVVLDLLSAEIAGNAEFSKYQDRRFAATGEIVLRRVSIKGKLDFREALLGNKDGLTLNLALANITGEALFASRFESFGAINIERSVIGGDLNFRGSLVKIEKPPKLRSHHSGISNKDLTNEEKGKKYQNSNQAKTFKSLSVSVVNGIYAPGISIGGHLLIDEGFKCNAVAVFRGAKVRCNLKASRADISCFSSDRKTGSFEDEEREELPDCALNLVRAKVQGSIIINLATISGMIRLFAAEAGGVVRFSGSIIVNNIQTAVISDRQDEREFSLAGKAHSENPLNVIFAIDGTSMKVKGGLFLDRKDGTNFASQGEVNFSFCEFGGDVVCCAGEFSSSLGKGAALNLSYSKILGNVRGNQLTDYPIEESKSLNATIQSTCEPISERELVTRFFGTHDESAFGEHRQTVMVGGLSCRGTHIGASLILTGATLVGGQRSIIGQAIPRKIALDADHITVEGDIHLNGLRDKKGSRFSSLGEVRLLSAKVGGSVVCSYADFRHSGHIGLSAEGIRIAGDLSLGDRRRDSTNNSLDTDDTLMRKRFSAVGSVNLSMGEICGNFFAYGGSFKSQKKDRDCFRRIAFKESKQSNPDGAENIGGFIPPNAAIIADSLKVWGDLDFRLTKVCGEFRLPNAQIGGRARFNGANLAGEINENRNDKAETTYALLATSISVKQHLILSGGDDNIPDVEPRTKKPSYPFKSIGAISLNGARIDGNFICGAVSGGDGTHAIISGHRSFESHRILRDYENHSLLMRSAIVRGIFTWKGVSSKLGYEDSPIVLALSTVETMNDEITSWPTESGVYLEGFSYKIVSSSLAQRELEEWQQWLELNETYQKKIGEQSTKDKIVASLDAHETLTKALKLHGQVDMARKIGINKQRTIHEFSYENVVSKPWRWPQFIASWIFGKTTSYGYSISKPIFYAAIIVATFTVWVQYEYTQGNFYPSKVWPYTSNQSDREIITNSSTIKSYYNNPDPYILKNIMTEEEFQSYIANSSIYPRKGHGGILIPQSYPKFYAVVWVADVFVPFLDLKQEEFWELAPSNDKTKQVSDEQSIWSFLKSMFELPREKIAMWLLIFSGWYFMTVALSMFSGVIKRD